MVLVSYERDGVFGFECWLIEARESPTRVRRLHLGCRDIFDTSILVFVRRPIKPRHLVVEVACKGKSDLSPGACRYSLVKRHLRDLGIFIMADLGRGRDLITPSGDFRRVYIDL